jgi:signal peptidase
MVLGAYAVVSAFGRFLPEMQYYLASVIAWSAVTAAVILMDRRMRGGNLASFRLNKRVILNALYLAALQLAALISTGFFMGFGRTPYSLAPFYILVNTAFLGTSIVAFEFARAYLVKSCSRKRILLGLVLVSVLFTAISFNFAAYTTALQGMRFFEFFGGRVIPAFAINLAASYLALLGGPTASLAYMFPLQAFQWLSPILPNPDWAVRGLVNTAIPALGLLFLNEGVRTGVLIRYGLIRKADLRKFPKKSSALPWMLVLIVAMTILWIPTGLLGFKPTVVASSSMSPTLEIGDVVIAVPSDPSGIRVGDLVQYTRIGDRISITHRVVSIETSGNAYIITTKGDANNIVDDPISVTGKIGKVVQVIPKIGWVTIYLKDLVSNLLQFGRGGGAAQASVSPIFLEPQLTRMQNIEGGWMP